MAVGTLIGALMNCRCLAVGMSLMGLLLVTHAHASDSAGNEQLRPLALGLGNGTLPTPDADGAVRMRRAALVGHARNGMPAQPGLKQRALQSVFSAPMPAGDELIAADQSAQFKFDRRGNAGRDLRRSYNNMCTNVSQKLWDEPNGKRIRFDVSGKPGVAFEIPLR